MIRIFGLSIPTLLIRNRSELRKAKKIETQTFQITFDKDIYTRLKGIAQANNTTVSEISRAVLQRLVEQYNQDNVETDCPFREPRECKGMITPPKVL